MSVSRNVSDYLLPDGINCLTLAFSDTTSDSSMASSWEDFDLILSRVLGIFKLPLNECTEFIILVLITIVVKGLSFYHWEKFRYLLLQHLQQ
jgi:hypothetical protein